MCTTGLNCVQKLVNYRISTFQLLHHSKSLHSRKSFVLGELSFCQNAFETVMFEGEQTSLLELPTRVSQLWPVTAIKCGDPTWKDPNFGSPKIAPKADSTTYMSKLNISKSPKFGSFHLGPLHLMAVTGCNGLILANNSKTELRSFSYNYNSKACWQKKSSPGTNDLNHI